MSASVSARIARNIESRKHPKMSTGARKRARAEEMRKLRRIAERKALVPATGKVDAGAYTMTLASLLRARRRT